MGTARDPTLLVLPPMLSCYSYFYLCIQIPKSKVRCLKTKTQRPNYIRSNGINAILFYLCRTKAERDQLKLIETMLKIFTALFELDQDFRDIGPQLMTNLMLDDYDDWSYWSSQHHHSLVLFTTLCLIYLLILSFNFYYHLYELLLSIGLRLCNLLN